ncbi:hypothetical protein A2U01_0064806, partial [Trifolium medium]|nr:hypothetical protein [Trifolium medium]
KLAAGRIAAEDPY